MFVRYPLIFGSALIKAFAIILIGASKVDGEFRYSPVTLNIMAEVLKLLTCLVVIIGQAVRARKAGSGRITSACSALKELSFWDSIAYGVPGLLYMLDNNLAFVVLYYISPVVYATCWNFKIVTTAIMFRICLKRQLSKRQWLAICLLLLGVVVIQADHIMHKDYRKHVHEDVHEVVKSRDPIEYTIGMLLLLVAIIISSSAGVYSEYMLKKRPMKDFYYQGLYLYAWGVVFNLLGLAFKPSQVQNGFFGGYNWWCVAWIGNQAVFGFTIALIFKILDNIAAVYSNSLSMIITLIASIIFGFVPSWGFGVGFAIVMISMAIYHTSVDSNKGAVSDADKATYLQVATVDEGVELDVVSKTSVDNIIINI